MSNENETPAASINSLFTWVIAFMAVEDVFSYDILMLANRVADKSIGTAAIGVKDHEIYLWYNEEWILQQTRQEITFILRHEVMHLVLHHCTHRNPGDPDERELVNRAMDIAINDLITEQSGCKFPLLKEDQWIDIQAAMKNQGRAETLIPNSQLPGKIIKIEPITDRKTGKTADVATVQMPDGNVRTFMRQAKKGERNGEYSSKYSFPSRLSYEAYLDLLRERQQAGGGGGKGKGKGKGKGQGQGQGKGQGQGEGEGEGEGQGQGEGEGQGQGGGGEGDLPQGPADQPGFDNHGRFGESKIVDEMVRDQVDRTQKSNRWGNIPAEVQELIKKAQTTEVPWWNLLRHELGRFISVKKISTIKRPDKKHGYPWLGKKSDTQDAVLCGIDTSGSVESKALAKFWAELARLQQFCPVFLMQFDCSLKTKKAIKMERRHMKEFKVLGRGGTDFQPLIDFAIENRYKKVVIMSDGYAPKPDLHGKHLELLWVFTPDGSDEKFPGRTVKMKKLV